MIALIECDACEGAGVITINPRYFHYDDPYAVEEIECEYCRGTGRAFHEVGPVEMDEPCWENWA